MGKGGPAHRGLRQRAVRPHPRQREAVISKHDVEGQVRRGRTGEGMLGTEEQPGLAGLGSQERLSGALHPAAEFHDRSTDEGLATDGERVQTQCRSDALLSQ